MSEEQRKILEMVSDGKVGVEEGEKLLAALDTPDTQPAPPTDGSKAKYVRIVIKQEQATEGCEAREKINLRIPIRLLRAGLNLGAMVPEWAQDKVNTVLKKQGLSFDLLSGPKEKVDEMVEHLCNLSVNVSGNRDKLAIFCERG